MLFDHLGVNWRLLIPIALQNLEKPSAKVLVEADPFKLPGNLRLDVGTGDAMFVAAAFPVGAVVIHIGHRSSGRSVVFDFAFGGHQASAASAADEAGEGKLVLLGLNAVVLVQNPGSPQA